jgi:hypothetical protein
MSESRPAWHGADEICPFADAPCPQEADQGEEEYCTLWTGVGCALDLELPAAPSPRNGPRRSVASDHHRSGFPLPRGDSPP